MFMVYFVSETAQVEPKNGRVSVPAANPENVNSSL